MNLRAQTVGDGGEPGVVGMNVVGQQVALTWPDEAVAFQQDQVAVAKALAAVDDLADNAAVLLQLGPAAGGLLELAGVEERG